MADSSIGSIAELDREVEALYQAIMGRQPFSYRAAEDPMYRSMADRYVQNGRLAMRDAMGSAAALTGGYGSSYAQAVGQQQFDEYLRQLSEAMPELYGLAYQQYLDEGDAMQDRYGLAYERLEGERAQEAARQAAEYQRQRDAIADERYAQEQAAKAAQQSYKQQQDRYQNLVKIISASGYDPSDAELAAAGLSRASADALRREYERTRQPAQVETRAVYYNTENPDASNVHQSTGDTAFVGRISKKTGSSSSTGSFKGGLSQR